jgi:hypothetical protein
MIEPREGAIDRLVFFSDAVFASRAFPTPAGKL